MKRTERALWLYKLLTYDVECYDFQSRAPNKGVISDVSYYIEALWIRENIPGVGDALLLIPMIDGKKLESLSVWLSFD